MESPRAISPPLEDENIIEGYLLKQGARYRSFWHDRYFTLTPDNVLLYFHRQGDVKPKGSFAIKKLGNCEISDLFVERHQKELIYCLRISWADDFSSDVASGTNGDSLEMDECSSFGGPSAPDNHNYQHDEPLLKSPGKRRKLGLSSKKNFGKFEDNAALTTPKGSKGRVAASDENSTNGVPAIPSLVEVEKTPISASPRGVKSTASESTVHMSNRTRTAYEEEKIEEQAFLRTQYLQKKSKTKRSRVGKSAQLAAAAGATIGVAVATAGVGLLASLVVMGVGAAAGGGTAALGWKKYNGELVIASADYETIRKWKSCLDASLETDNVKKSTWGQLFAADDRKTRRVLLPQNGRQVANESFRTPKKTTWKLLEGGWVSFLGTGVQGLRVFREEIQSGSGRRASTFSVDGKPSSAMKAQSVISASPLDAFLCLMSFGQTRGEPAPKSEHRSSFRIVESIDDNTDVIHLVFGSLYLFPSWTTPRDFVLYRYWRFEPDGSYVVCYESVQHSECPPAPGYVRGDMHQVVTISPLKKSRRLGTKNQSHECFMTAVVQIDPKGWVPTMPFSFLWNQSYGEAFSISSLLQLLDIRDAIDQDRFVTVSEMQGLRPTSFSMVPPSSDLSRNFSTDSNEEMFHEDHDNYDFAYSDRESVRQATSATGITTTPPPLNFDAWAEPDSNSFRVRGKAYKQDKKKYNAGPSIGRLITVDIVGVDKPLYSGFSVHPTERIQLALKKEAMLKEKGLESDMPPFIFAVNIVIPGPPYYHAIFYYAVDDMSQIDGSDGSPSSKLCSEFFFGESDAFRDKTFKLIPQIVEGNFIVRKAVGSTPAIMGKKLRQMYVRDRRFCEVIIDCGSSTVATGVINLSLGYAKTLVVDMGFLLEGDHESTLPERIFGCVRVKHLTFGSNIRHVKAPP